MHCSGKICTVVLFAIASFGTLTLAEQPDSKPKPTPTQPADSKTAPKTGQKKDGKEKPNGAGSQTPWRPSK
jgi:hypothetical protein